MVAPTRFELVTCGLGNRFYRYNLFRFSIFSVGVSGGASLFCMTAPRKKPPVKVRGVYEKVPGSGVWWIRFQKDGKIRRERVGRKSDAIALYQDRKSQIVRGEKLPPTRGQGTKVSVLAEAAIAWYRERERRDQRTFGQRMKVIIAEIGHIVAEELSPNMIDKWLTSHESWSPATKNRYRTVLSKAFQLALQRGDVSRNPARLVEHRPETTKRIRYLLPEEEVRLREAVLKLSPKQLPALEVALHTGMRRGEQFGLTWDRVDFQRKTIYLDQTKNGSHRELPMSNTCYEALQTLHKTRTDDPGVFPSSKFKNSIKDPKKWFAAALTDAKITGFRWHDLRHTFVSRLVMKGNDLRTVQELSGHKELSMLTRYAHLAPAHNRSAIESLDRE